MELSEDLEQFSKTFDQIIRDISAINSDLTPVFEEEVKKATERLQKCLKFTATSGKMLRGCLVAKVFESLAPDPSKKNLFLARVLGWVVEFLHASFCIADDIMDRGETRHGKKCWYLEINSAAIATNDSYIVMYVAYEILKKYFSEYKSYSQMLDLLTHAAYRTSLGQNMDLIAESKKDPSHFTEQLYETIVTYKTAFYTVYLPLALGMALAGVDNKTPGKQLLWEKVKKVAMEVGVLYQIQDDILDVFADKGMIGKKLAQDIESGKCTWLFVQAKKLCNEEQLKILYENYGSSEKEKVDKIKKLYKSLQLRELYREHKERAVISIMKGMEDLNYPELQDAMKTFFEVIIFRKY